MKKLIFITGSARSGKSRFAVSLARGISDKVAFVATAKPLDSEMNLRIIQHKKERPKTWLTIEGDGDIINRLTEIEPEYKVVIIDCLTMFVSDLVLEGLKDAEINDKIKKLNEVLLNAPYATIIVSNEVGGGIVPGNRLARRFRDLAGIVNQTVAGYASIVYLMVSGIPVLIKEVTG